MAIKLNLLFALTRYISLLLPLIQVKSVQIGLGCVAICVITFAVWLPSLGVPFLFVDSPTILLQLINYSPFEYFFRKEGYIGLSWANFTPWITLSWHLDYILGGFDVSVYRIHHVISLMALVILLFLLGCKVIGSGVF